MLVVLGDLPPFILPGPAAVVAALIDLIADGRLCLLYTSDAADERSSVDLGGRRIIKKKNECIADVRRTYTDKTDRNHHTDK